MKERKNTVQERQTEFKCVTICSQGRKALVTYNWNRVSAEYGNMSYNHQKKRQKRSQTKLKRT